MLKLIHTAKSLFESGQALPFAIYSSVQQQRIFNVPVHKPLLIIVLEGSKRLRSQQPVDCPAGQFIFLSNNANVDIRNIPSNSAYFALLIEFDFSDFDLLKRSATGNCRHVTGAVNKVLENTLLQFVEWSAYSPQTLWASRRQELLQLLVHQGYTQVADLMEQPQLSHKLHTLFMQDLTADLSVTEVCGKLAMSESTLRRRLTAEGTQFQTIKDLAKLTAGLHLVQTSDAPIGLVAEQSGFISQSRFTEKFKSLYGVTPSELRKTRLTESGEKLTE